MALQSQILILNLLYRSVSVVSDRYRRYRPIKLKRLKQLKRLKRPKQQSFRLMLL